MRFFIPTTFAVLMSALLSGTASAHALRMQCRLAGDQFVIEAFYSDGRLAAKANVEVKTSDSKTVIASGQTDDKGRWSCAMPAPGKYVVDIDAGEGHRASRPYTISGVPEPSDSKSESPTKSPAAENNSSEPTREDLTRTPWLEIALGLCIIVVLSIASVVVLRLRRGTTD